MEAILATIDKEDGPAKLPGEEENPKEGPTAVVQKNGSIWELVDDTQSSDTEKSTTEEVREEKVEEVSPAPPKKKHKVRIKRKRARPMEEVREEKVEEVSHAPPKRKHKKRIKRSERCMRDDVDSF